MEKLGETYRFPDVPKFEKGQDFQKWLADYQKWQTDFQMWVEKMLSDMSIKINWLIGKF